MTDDLRARTHRLKTWPEFFAALRTGAKCHEVRANDRDFRVGDVLVLEEWEPGTAMYTGEVEHRRVTYITSAFLPAPLCAMSLAALVAPPQEPEPWKNLRGHGTTTGDTPEHFKQGAAVAPPQVAGERVPRRPEELVDALQDRIHPSSGSLRAAKPVHGGRRLPAEPGTEKEG